MADRRGWERIAAAAAEAIGREVVLGRSNLGLSIAAAARLAGVSRDTQVRVEAGSASVGIDTACRVAAAIGLKIWVKVFPMASPSLRDTGQLRCAELLRNAASSKWKVAIEFGLGNLLSADVVLFGPLEIIHIEIERYLADWQAQYRAAASKRDLLGNMHTRPVRLVIAIEDTEHNRAAVRTHRQLVSSMLPAGTRTSMRAIRSGDPLGSDGIVWVRPRRLATAAA